LLQSFTSAPYELDEEPTYLPDFDVDSFSASLDNLAHAIGLVGVAECEEMSLP
jgi:hypothetical protein